MRSSISERLSARLSARMPAWGLRLLLGATLLVFSEIVWWSNNPTSYAWDEWAALVAIYLALAALMLDLLVRFHVGDVLGLLVVAGLYGLLNGSLIAHSAFTSLPLSLVSRPLGLHTLGGGLLAMLLLGWLLDGRGLIGWRALALSVVGLLAGIWVRWFPLLETNGFPLPSLETVLALTGIGLAVVGALLLVTRRFSVQHVADVQLRPWEWVPVIGVLAVAFLVAASRQIIGGLDGAVMGLLLGYLIILLFFQRGQYRVSLLARLAPPRPAGPAAVVVYAAALLLPVILGYQVPGDSPDGLPLQAITAALVAFGVAWLPGVSLAVGLRAYIRLMREEG